MTGAIEDRPSSDSGLCKTITLLIAAEETGTGPLGQPWGPIPQQQRNSSALRVRRRRGDAARRARDEQQPFVFDKHSEHECDRSTGRGPRRLRKRHPPAPLPISITFRAPIKGCCDKWTEARRARAAPLRAARDLISVQIRSNEKINEVSQLSGGRLI